MNKKMVRFIGTLACVVALSGCMSQAERDAAQEVQSRADSAECKKLGFKIDTDAFGECLLKLREIRATERTAMRPDYMTSSRIGMEWGWMRY